MSTFRAIVRRLPRLARGLAPYGLALLFVAPTEASAQGCQLLCPPPDVTSRADGGAVAQIYFSFNVSSPGKTCTYHIWSFREFERQPEKPPEARGALPLGDPASYRTHA